MILDDLRIRPSGYNRLAMATKDERLEGLPGLRWLGTGVEGYFDAIMAALVRLGFTQEMAAQVTRPRYKPFLASVDARLRPYQLAGVNDLRCMLQTFAGAILGDDMGLGKSRQAIATAGAINAKTALIACPAAVREGWREELQKYGVADSDVAVLVPGDSKFAKASWLNARSAKWIVSSYSLLDRAYDEAFRNAARQPALFIMDEAHQLKGRGRGGSGSSRSKVAEEVALRSTYKLALTGTPFDNATRDLWRILYILFGRRFGDKTAFDKAYCGAFTGEHGFDNKGSSNEAELKFRLSCFMVRREKREVLKDLPPLQRQVVWLDSDEAGRNALAEALMYRHAESTQRALTATLKSKEDAALTLAEQAKRFLMFTYKRADAKRLAETLCKAGTPCVWVTGDLSVEQRQERIKDAAARQIGLVATIDSIGTGVNLQSVASIGIMHVLDWRPLKMAQAEARIHRLGQTTGVVWYYLACRDTMDHVVIDKIVGKLDQFVQVVGNAADAESLRNDLKPEENEAASLRSFYVSI